MGTGNDLARVLGWGKKYVGDEHEIEELLQDFEKAKPTPFDRYVTDKFDTRINQLELLKVIYMKKPLE